MTGLPLNGIAEVVPDESRGPAELFERQVLQDEVQPALHCLSASCREALVLWGRGRLALCESGCDGNESGDGRREVNEPGRVCLTR
jgi:hypothetical protein